jgi:hypothetical protein
MRCSRAWQRDSRRAEGAKGAGREVRSLKRGSAPQRHDNVARAAAVEDHIRT